MPVIETCGKPTAYFYLPRESVSRRLVSYADFELGDWGVLFKAQGIYRRFAKLTFLSA